MFESYRRLFAAPGTVAFTLAGLVGRMPVSMFGVSVVIMIATRRDSYALAGAVSAAGLLAVAVIAPQIGRLVDRYGQARVAVPTALISSAGGLALLLCTRYGAPTWTLFAAQVVGACVPSVGGMARARWATLYRDRPDLLHSANSLEQTLDEVCFIVGPVLAAVLCTTFFPEAGLLVTALLLASGTLLFAAQRRTEPPVRPGHHRAGSPLRIKGVKEIAATFLFTGAIFGSTEVVTVAYADEAGRPAAAGVILALFAGGSAVAGLTFGALTLRGRTETRFLLGVAGMCLFMLPVQLAGNVGVLAVMLFVAGLATAPTMITSMTLVQERVPQDQLNEGMTLTTTGMVIGVSAGATAGGWIVDAFGAGAGYAVPAVASVLALLAALLGFSRRDAARSPRSSRPARSPTTSPPR